VVTSNTSLVATGIGSISKLPEVVQDCKVNNPAMAKKVIIFFMIKIF
jgi:hypothetical protein